MDNNITQAEDERTILAKGNQFNTQRRAINSAHIKNNKPAIGLAQCSCNTAYSLGTTIGQTFKKNSNNKHVRFAKNKKVHLFDKAETPIMITYDSGADGHYISKKDRHKVGLPIIRKSTRRVGVANGGVSQAKFVTQLPFKALAARATQADTFQDFSPSLMSIGKTANDGTISIFTKNGVTVHKEMDVLITCKGEQDVTESHLSNNEDSGNRGNPQNRRESVCARPTVSMIYHLRNRPSNGCMQYVDTQLS